MIFLTLLLLLWPDPAHAGLIGGLIGLFAGGATVAGVALVVGQIALSVAIANYQKRKMKKALAAQQSGIRSQFTATGGVNPLSFIVGRYATNGHLVAPPMSQPAESNPPNAYLTYVMDFGDVPGATVTRVGIEDEWVTFGPLVDPAPPAEGSEGEDLLSGVLPGFLGDWRQSIDTSGFGAPALEKYDGFVWLRACDGSQTEADPFLLAKFGADPERPWSADMVGRGIPYVVLTFLRNAERFPGEPRRRLEVMGIPLYDPRLDSTVGGSGSHRWADRSTWAQTDNPKVIHYNILRGIEIPGFGVWGARAAAEELPLDNWFAAMNECDLPVDDGKGGTEPQFRFGFEILVSDKPATVCDEIDRSCSGKTVEIGGVYKTRVGGVGLPVYFFTDGDILVTRPQEMDPFPGLEDSANALSASYPDPDILWETREAPAYLNAEWEAEDASTEWDADTGQWVRQPRRLMQEVSLPGVASGSQVQRLLAAMAKDGRRWRNHGLTLPPEACVLEPLDAVTWTSERNGYNAKLFEIILTADPVGELRPRLGIVEADPSDYDFNPDGYLPNVAPSILPVSAGLVTVPGFTAVAHVLRDATGVDRRPAILCAWTGALVGEARGLALELRLAASQTTVWTGSTGDILTGQVILSEVLPLTSYEVRAMVLSDTRPAPWTPWVPVTTFDVRLGAEDLANSVQEALTEAMAVRGAADARADEVLANATALIEGLRDDVGGDVAAIRDDLALSLPREIDTGRAVETLAERLAWLTLQLSQARTDMADAGIYIDPTAGRARIEAVARIDTAISEVSVVLDAIQSEISLRATYSDLTSAITAAQLDPADLPELDDLRGRISDAEITISGLEGAIDLKADTTTLDGISVRVTDAELQIDSLSDEIALRVETTTFDALESRVGTAEVTLGTLDAPGLTLAVSDSRAALELTDDLAANLLRDILQGRATRQTAQADIAYAQQDMRALVNEDRTSIASLQTQLGVAAAGAAAAVAAEASVRASETAAAAASVLVLSAQVNDPATGLAATRATVNEQQTALATLEGRAEATYTLRVKAGGAAAGLEIVAADDPVSGPASIIRLASDQFIVNGATILEDAFIAKLIARQALVADLRVDTLMIKGNAITIPVRTFVPYLLQLPAYPTWAVAAQVTIAREGVETDLDFHCAMDVTSAAVAEISLFRDATLLCTWFEGIVGNQSQTGFRFTDRNLGTGPTVYSVKVRRADPAVTGGWDGFMRAFSRYFRAQQFKR
ncbi:MAG: DUF1983 domain-containing protein [Rhodobacteraceae bacterium]|nr:DUF1983 domain-containing protein [Paracoccaceae bacterium]